MAKGAHNITDEKRTIGDEDLDDESLEMSPQEEKSLLRRIDFRLIPWCCILYLLSFLDRVNIGQAKTAGLFKDLRLDNYSYNIALTTFFISYCAFEIPSNLVLRYLKPSIWITLIMFFWGLTMTLMGLCTNAAGLQAARFFLGLAESGLFPGLNLMLTFWYTREQLGLRVGIFFSGATLAGAFGGLLAFGIRHMNGIGGRAGWAWIFILEGLLTVIVALPTYWILPDFPDDPQRFMTPLESKKWRHRLRKNQGVANAYNPFTWKEVISAFTDWRTYAYSLMYICIAQPLYSLALFTPSIIVGLGYTNANANLLTIPPYVLGCVTCLGAAFLSDRYAMRSPFLVVSMSVVAIAYIILLNEVAIGVKYFCLFLAVAGVSPSIALAITFVGNSIFRRATLDELIAIDFGPAYKRSAALGLFFTTGNSAGIISSWVYPTTSSPRFILGHAVALGFACGAVILAAIIGFANHKENKRRDRLYGKRDGTGLSAIQVVSPEQKEKFGLSHLTDQEVIALGDKHPDFRYIV